MIDTCRLVVAAFAAVFACTLPAPEAASPDPVDAEIARWSAYQSGMTSTDEMWNQVKEATGPAMERTEEALRDGRRLLALQRLAATRENLSAWEYLRTRPPGLRTDASGFEAEWARMGRVLRDDLRGPSPASFDGVQPALVRALGEAVLHQVRVYYDASLEYGRSTTPDSGLFYLGAAQAQREFAAFCRQIAAPTTRKAPPVRGLSAEIAALQRDLLSVYKPPVSIDRHTEFIVASGVLKEARELDEAGLRYGALLRYLEAARRFAPLRPATAPPADAGALEARLGGLAARLEAGGIDHSLGRLFFEAAQADIAHPAAGAGPAVAAAIADDVLPRYFAALAPARPAKREPAPRVTVTLVRWPYT
ncbi:MAG TPA: hypothetical protein VGV60_13110 [Candidatus Polarisedimenticolia bacterium]|jgi:hypothetical protein|nr:hypothetical protein [Candidatus Polarisedimenticolia bacterium]